MMSQRFRLLTVSVVTSRIITAALDFRDTLSLRFNGFFFLAPYWPKINGLA